MEAAFVNEVCATLTTALEVVRAAGDTSAPSPTRERLSAVAEALKSESAKVGFMFSQKEAPGRVAGEALLAALRDAAATLCMLLAAAAAGGGPTLRKTLDATASATVGPVIDLVKAAGAGPSRAAGLPQLAGLVMERCDAAGKAPLDDRTAIGRALTSVARQVADAAGELGDEEGPVAAGAAEVLKAAGGVLRATMRTLLHANASPLGGEGDLWESVLFHGKQLAAAADDLAVATYESDDAEGLAGAAEAVATGCELLAEEVPGGAAGEAAEEVRRAAAALMEAVAAAANGEALETVNEEEEEE